MANKPKVGLVTRLKASRSWWLLFAVAGMIGLAPIMSDFLNNRFETSVQDLVLPVLAIAIVTAIISSIYRRLYKRDPLAGFMAAVISAILLTNNYDSRFGSISPLLSAITPLPKLNGAETSVLSLVFIAAIFVVAGLAGRWLSRLVAKRNWPAKDIIGSGVIAITVAFALLLVPTAKTLIGAWSQYFYKPPALVATLPASAQAAPKPDIYYIVMEDYANQTQLTQQFGFTNQAFSSFLGTNGYYSDPNAHQNYPYTTMSLASTLNAGYNNDLIKQFAGASAQTIIPYHRAVQYSSVISTLKGLGYHYDEIGSWYETNNQGPLADTFYLKDRQLILFGHTTYIDGFTQNELSNGVFWQFLQEGISLGSKTIARYAGEDQVHLTNDALGTLKNLADQPAGGRFIMAHLIIPHEPYYFNADGSLATTPTSNSDGHPIKQKYLGQLKYLNSQIEPILTAIKQHSNGQAVVVLQSDEGPHPMALNDHDYDANSESDEINNQDMRTWSNTDLALKYGAMAAYSIPKATPSDLAAGADSVNVFRLVLNRYFGATLPYLSQCYYAYPNGRAHTFVYEDITQRITGQANAACAAEGTGPSKF